MSEGTNTASRVVETTFPLHSRKATIQKHENFLLGAFAELVDNASEASASTLEINMDHEQTGALFFLDNGIGMDRSTINMLFTKLTDTNKGSGFNYGVGFKTGAFNLGEEILVLSKTYECGPRCTYRNDVLAGVSSAKCKCADEDKKPVGTHLLVVHSSPLVFAAGGRERRAGGRACLLSSPVAPTTRPCVCASGGRLSTPPLSISRVLAGGCPAPRERPPLTPLLSALNSRL